CGDEAEGYGSRMGVAGIERIPYDHSSAGLEFVHFSPASAERVPCQPTTPWTSAVPGVASEGGCNAYHGAPVGVEFGRGRIVGGVCAPSVSRSRSQPSDVHHCPTLC